ncbi:MAG TPA: PIG-L deacetylase family protein [Ktedonobacteraceae bacterium]|nr:PIG-L deacetylase family protein [Ktedonobacteraceae bacterium]
MAGTSSVLTPPVECILVIQAHPDDAEHLCGGTIAHLVNEGREVHYLFVTRGDKGSDDPEMTTERLAAIREQEQRNAAATLGVKSVTFLEGYSDGEVEPGLQLRKEIAEVIRRIKPQAALTFDPWRKNELHPDHRAVGITTVDAIAQARGRLSYPEQLVEGITPHKVNQIYFFSTDRPNVWVDITTTMEQKLAALRCHESQMTSGKEESIRRRAIIAGAEYKFKYAEVFHRYSI